MRSAVLACILTLSLLVAALPARAAIDYDDNFEAYANTAALLAAYPNHTGGCSASSTVFSISTTRAHSGTKSIRMRYTGHDVPPDCGIFRFFSARTRVFVRYWTYHENFTPDSVSTKIYAAESIGSLPGGGTSKWPNGWWGMINGSRTLTFTAQIHGNAAATTNYGSTSPTPQNQWLCMETELFMGTPGNADGTVRAWRTNTSGAETLLMSHTAVPFLPSTSRTNPDGTTQGADQKFNATELFKQNAVLDSLIYYDDFAVGTTRVGCGSGGPTDPVPGPPQPPTGLMVE